MILWVFIEFFWSQNSHYRYFTDIFSEISAQAQVLHSRDFSIEKSLFSYFSTKN